MIRFEDWPSRLATVLNAAETRRFSYGTHDCTLFAANCVFAMTGHDPAAFLRGTYRDENQAFEILNKNGGMKSAVTAALGIPCKNMRAAMRGDVAMVETKRGHALGVVDLTGARIASAGDDGLAFLPLKRGLMFWSV